MHCRKLRNKQLLPLLPVSQIFRKEFLLLYKLAASTGRTFTKQQLMDEVWGYETEADPHTIEVHIGRIRERFKDNPDFEIVTMRGIGYKVVKK